MSAEIQFSASNTPARAGKRCRYCARILTKVDAIMPDESRQHCDSAGCIWCKECANGETSVSPVNEERDK